MLVVDTNIIAYLYLPTAYTEACETLLTLDAHWSAPVLWKSELRNVLALYLRKEMIDLITAMEIQSQAELLLAGNEFEVNSNDVLALVNSSACSAYDCEFISLARSFDIKLITSDKKLTAAFPEYAILLQDFIDVQR